MSTITSRLSTQLEHVQFVRTQLVGAYFRVQGFPNRLCFGIGGRCVLQGLGVPNRLCFATMSKEPNKKCLNLENIVIFQGFDSQYKLYKQVLDIEDQLLCPKFKQKQRKHSMTLRNRLNHFTTRLERSASKPGTKTSKLTPNDDSRHVQLINLEP